MNAMSRTRFATPEANIVVSTDGYFDVYPLAERTNNDKPSYRGRLAELGPGIRGHDDRLMVRPSSSTLRDAVMTWSATNASAALRGDLGKSAGEAEPAA